MISCFSGTHVVENMPVQGRIIDTRALIRTESKDRSRQYNRHLDG
jgi:hypothetical protein